MTNQTNTNLFNRFLKDFWPKYRTQLYSKLYNTYHPSSYTESFNRPGGNFEDALELVADAVHEGKKLGLLDSSVHWSDIYNYESRDSAALHQNVDSEDFPHPGIDDDGIPTLNNQLEILDNTNLDWVHAILLFDVYEEIVDEFKHYCGENGIDESGMGECMDEFPPDARGEMVNGTLKQDYYTLYNFMRELERAGVPVTDYLKDPTYPNIIKLVDTGASDYNEEGEQRKIYSKIDKIIDDVIDDEEIGMDAPDRINESAPQAGSTSVEGFDDTNLPYETKYMTLDEILRDIKKIEYYEEVIEELEEGPDKPDGSYNWDVVNTVIRYADYWMKNPASLVGPDFPPIQVIGDEMRDGSHRIATLNALATHLAPDEDYWRNVKLPVRFYDPEIVMDSGHFYPWVYDIPEDRLQDAINQKSAQNWKTLKGWKEEQEDTALSPFEFDQDGNERRVNRDINNEKGWRRESSVPVQNNKLKKYLDKYTDDYTWSKPPHSGAFSEENIKMYSTPYIMYVHLLQTSEGRNNVIDALEGILTNETDDANKLQLKVLLMIWRDEEEKVKKIYEEYKDIIEKNATLDKDDGANVFAAIKYAKDNMSDKEGIFEKFKLNGWSSYKFNLETEDLTEQQNHSSKEEPTQSIFQKTLKDMGVQFQFVGTFGFGISGMFGMVKDVLEGRYPSLSEGEIILIFLSGLSYLSINLVKDFKEVKQEVDKRGLKEYVNKTVELLKDFENISLKVVEKAGYTVSSLAELLGYTFLLVPILDVTNRLIQENGFDIVSLASYLKGAIISVGIFYIRNLFNSLVLRLRDSRERKQIYGDEYEVDDNEEDEMVEEGEVIGKVLSERFKHSKILTEERIGELSLLDESVDNRNLKWLVTEENKINWLNISISEGIKNLLDENKKLFTNATLKEITSKFKNKDPKDLNNYESLIELTQLTNRVMKNSQLHEEVYMSKIAETATTDVVRDIFEVVNLFEGGEEYFLLPDYYTDKDGDDYRYGKLQFNVEVNIIENDQEQNFVLDSAMGGEYDDTIYVDIVLSSNFNEKDYESLQIVLSEYIRHEIEHILQTIDSDRPDIIDKDDTMSPFDYYSQKHEVDAQKVGFERRAKMEDKSVEEVIADYLGYRQSMDNLSDSEKQELIGKLTN